MAKFMLLIYGDPKKWADADEATGNAIMSEYFAVTKELVDAGAMVAGDPLHGAETAKTVAKDGVVTDGPFADTAEHLGGYYIIDVADIDAATAWAAKLPGVPRGYDRIEVRPVMALPPEVAQA